MFQFWEEWWRREIESLRPLLMITLYGSYYPKTELDLLLSLVQMLKDNNYTDSDIVKNRPNLEGLSGKQLSELCLRWSDSNFLIFTHTGKGKGVSYELSYVFNAPAMVDRKWRCVVFDDVSQGFSSLPMDISEDFDKEVKYVKFSNIEELKNAMKNWANSYLRGPLYQTLLARKGGL